MGARRGREINQQCDDADTNTAYRKEMKFDDGESIDETRKRFSEQKY